MRPTDVRPSRLLSLVLLPRLVMLEPCACEAEPEAEAAAGGPTSVLLEMPGWAYVQAVACLDVDGDGDLDLVPGHVEGTLVGGDSGPTTKGAEQVLLRNEGDRRWSREPLATWTGEEVYPEASAVGDVDGDGIDELVVATLGGLRLLGAGEGGLVDRTDELSEAARRRRAQVLCLVDLTGDGSDEIVLAGTRGWLVIGWNDATDGRSLDVIDRRGGGLFSFGGLGAGSSLEPALHAVDWDGDGDLDLFQQHAPVLRVLLHDGTGHLEERVLIRGLLGLRFRSLVARCGADGPKVAVWRPEDGPRSWGRILTPAGAEPTDVTRWPAAPADTTDTADTADAADATDAAGLRRDEVRLHRDGGARGDGPWQLVRWLGDEHFVPTGWLYDGASTIRALADLDGDGVPDVVDFGDDTVHVLYGREHLKH